jgi:succinate dehydrogenase / fumarate reductase flavoprotein subunit
MIRTLQDRGVQLGFDVFMECTIIRLLTDGNRVVGAFGYWREQGRFVVLKAKAVVIATGGIGKAWRVTSNSWEYTGDGMALAYDAGAQLQDMEFVQFHPTGMVWPPGVQGLLVTEAVRGEGGILRNKLGERFMEKYDPKRMELSTRDVVARSIYTEVREGRGSAWAEIRFLTCWSLAGAQEWLRRHLRARLLPLPSIRRRSLKLSAICWPHLIAVKARTPTLCIAICRK